MPRPPLPQFSSGRWFGLSLMLIANLVCIGLLYLLHSKLERDKLHEVQLEFAQHSQQIQTYLSQRMQAYHLIMRASNGLFSASHYVSRDEWHQYVQNLQLDRLYPGIQGLAYVQRVDAADYPAHLSQVVAEGQTDYQIIPQGQRAQYFPIRYLEPFDWRNRRALGFDLYTEPLRRAAMERARDTGELGLTAPLTLLQETDTDIQSGILMFWPIYGSTDNPRTPAQRQHQLQGYIYGAFRMGSLLEQIHSELIAPLALIELNLTDRAPNLKQNQLFDNRSIHSLPLLQQNEVISLGGRSWQLSLSSSPAYEQQIHLDQTSRWVFPIGLSLLFLISSLGSLYLIRRNRAEQQLQQLNTTLRDERDRFSQLIEGAPIAMLMLNHDNQITLLNYQAEQLFGLKRTTLIGLNISQFLPDTALLQESSTPITAYDTQARHSQGYAIAVEVSLTPVTTNALPFRLCSILDLRARRQAEDHFRLVIEASPNAIIILNPEGQIELINQQTEQLFGYPRHELLGQNIEILLPEHLKETHAKLRQGYVKRPEARQMGGNLRLFGRHQSGRELAVEVGLAPIYNNGITRIQAVVVDISARNAVEQQLQEQTQQLANSNRYKSEFLANMSHELRTPLNSILILSEQLKQSKTGLLDDKQRQHAEIIHRSGKDLLQLINDILDLSRIEAGKMNLCYESLCLPLMLSELKTSLQAQFERKGLVFDIQQQPGLPPYLWTDPQKLQQILRNLLANALKFTLQGRVLLEVSVQEHQLPPQCTSKQAVLFSVRDTGIGIAQSDVEQIFIAFQQVDGSSQRRFGGSGLGLAICRQLSHLLGGDIRLHSQLGQGSEFQLYLPLKEPETKPKASVIPPLSAPNPTPMPNSVSLAELNQLTLFANKRVLLVDDDMRNLYALSALLNYFGLYVEHARNGMEALNRFAQGSFDLILMDIAMPIMDGYESIKLLKLQYRCRIPIIAVTAHAMKGDQEKCLLAGADDYLAKPVEQQQMYNMLNKWLSAPVQGE